MNKALQPFIIALALLLLSCNLRADDFTSFSGHSKYRLLNTSYPDDSLYQRYVGDDAVDQSADIRLKLNWQHSDWSTQADYQLIALTGDTLENSYQLPPSVFPIDSVQNDDRRLFDLTHIIHEDDDSALLHRLDRLYIGHTSANTVFRFGRQAISWGNGLMYAPMDFFNPFDPSAIDKEYKTGDDMLYGQYLFNDGNDIQAVRVIRRNNEDDIANNVSSTAVKYHGLTGQSEFDLLLAQHFDDNIIGFGGNIALGGAIWHGDITITDTDTDTVTSIVTGLSYSWVWGKTNYSGVIEYFYNGFGITNGDYSTNSLLQRPDLLTRVQRGELYTLGKEYLAASATIELAPLWIITPGLFHNLSDGSSLIQILSKHDLTQNSQLLLAFDIPTGSSGTEYGGIESGTPGINLSTDYRFSAQIGWYF